jgi:hypothetical protein
VSVRIWRLAADGSGGTQDSATFTRYTEFLDVPAPRIALVRVNWVNAAGTVTTPTDAQMLRTLRLAERMLPFPYFETSILGVEVTSSGAFAMTATGGGCNQAWQDLNTTLAATRILTTLFQLGDIVFGMVPRAAIPPGTTSFNSGCGIESAGCFIDEAETFAHEMGHLYGRLHTAVPGDDTSDPAYPNYGGDRWSIGEVGVDTGTSPPTLFEPATTDDIMSYRNNLWISPFTYRGILDARDRHQAAPADPRRVRPLLFLELRIRRTERGLTGVEVKRAFRLEAPGRVTRNLERATSPLSIDLLDANRQVLATHHCFYVPPQPHCGCGCGGHGLVPLEREPYIDLVEVIEWPGDHVSALSCHRGREPLAVLEVGHAPHVGIESPEFRDDRIVVRVHTESATTPSVVVLFSADDGLTWQPVGFDPPDGQLSVEAARLPGGERCRFRAIAGAELRSAVADTEPFALAPSPRRLHIVAPEGECGIPPGSVALGAMLDNRGRRAPFPNEIRWQSSLQGELGAGYHITAELGEGEHEILASAPDGLGGLLSERAIIVVGGKAPGRP